MVASWQEYRDRQSQRAERLDEEPLAASVSKALISAEARIGVVQMRMCAEVIASGENPSELAEDMSEVRQAGSMVKAAHEILTRVVARRLNWPIPTEGDR